MTESGMTTKAKLFNTKFIWLGVLFGLFSSVGYTFYKTGTAGFQTISFYILFLILSCLFIPFLSLIYHLTGSSKPNTKALPKLFNSKYFFIYVWAFIFILWVPVWLGSFPGFFSYDANRIWSMYVKEEIDAINSVLDTMVMSSFLELFYRVTGAYNKAIALYCLVRMTLLSAVFAYCVCWLKKRGVSALKLIVSAAFFALFPLIAVFACCTSKDVFFAAAILLFLMLCIDFKENELSSLRRCAAISALGFLITTLRANSLLAFIPFAVIFVLECKKERIKAAIVLSASLVLLVSFNAFTTYGLKIPSDYPHEALSVPIQQLARTAYYNGDSLTESQLDGINRFLGKGVYKKYSPKCSDPVKENFNAKALKKSPLDFYKLWTDVGKNNVGIYIDSFVANSVDLVYPLGYIDGYLGEPSYFRVQVEYPGELNSMLPSVYRAYNALFNDPKIISNKFVSTLFSPALVVWIALYALGCAYANNGPNKSALWFFVILAVTFLFGPIVINRYVLYLYFAMPLILHLARERAVKETNAALN